MVILRWAVATKGYLNSYDRDYYSDNTTDKNQEGIRKYRKGHS